MTDLSFEKALTDLEQTVAKLEKGNISLNESLALFEKGVKLARFLRSELDKAERKVEILLKDEKGDIKAETFDIGDDREAPAEEEKDSGKGDKGDPEDIPF